MRMSREKKFIFSQMCSPKECNRKGEEKRGCVSQKETNNSRIRIIDSVYTYATNQLGKIRNAARQSY